MTSDHDKARRAVFFTAGEPLFERFGFRKTTIEEICRQAGASKRTFYELFRDKCDFFLALLIHVSNEEVEVWRSSQVPGMTAREKLDSYLDHYVKMGRDHRVFRLGMEEPELHGCFHDFCRSDNLKPMIDTLGDVIAEGMDTGEFRKTDPATAAWIIYATLDSVYYVLPNLTGLDGPDRDAVMAEETRTMIINGLLAR